MKAKRNSKPWNHSDPLILGYENSLHFKDANANGRDREADYLPAK